MVTVSLLPAQRSTICSLQEHVKPAQLQQEQPLTATALPQLALAATSGQPWL